MAGIAYTIKLMPKNATLAERLANRSMWEPNSGCLLWFGCVKGPAPNNYGSLRWQGRYQSTHRLAWIDANGPIPEGMEVCHKCDVPACINVDHLFLGTRDDNMADMARKGRGFRMLGEDHTEAKLTAFQVLAISKDKRHLKVIAAEYGIGKSLAGYIRQKKVWKHLWS